MTTILAQKIPSVVSRIAQELPLIYPSNDVTAGIQPLLNRMMESYVYLWCMRKGEETAYPAGKGKRPD
ncbi:MAG: hypothetical protein K6T90_15275, partial [Leptolyngbyaceae cyanobacterium HOT.MB2.61]|nr:hypothetical protein [Leptolyngbyaceae cyanobacterium HOT.MB2.61]